MSVARRCVAGMKEDDLENTDQEGDNYLHVAVCRTDVYMVEALLERLNRSSKLDMINRQNHAQQVSINFFFLYFIRFKKGKNTVAYTNISGADYLF